jgi:hypothetical protein
MLVARRIRTERMGRKIVMKVAMVMAVGREVERLLVLRVQEKVLRRSCPLLNFSQRKLKRLTQGDNAIRNARCFIGSTVLFERY